MRTRRPTTAAILVTLTLLAGACGGEGDGGSTVIETDATTGDGDIG